MTSALVVGGAGFIGSHLVERLLADDVAVDVVDDLSHGSLGNLADARNAALRPAQHLDALDALRAAVVRDVEIGLHLDH